MGNEAEKITKNKIKDNPDARASIKTKKSNNKDKQKKEKINNKRKKFLFITSVIIIICIIAFIFFILMPSDVKAQLVIEFGTVEIKHEGGSWTSAKNGTILYQSDSVKTGDNSSASIIFFESSIIRLDSNTEVKLEELFQKEGEKSVTIKQDIGRTWNTVSKMSGIDNYEVQTPTTVASVRGTSFVVLVYSDGGTFWGLDIGFLNVSTWEKGKKLQSINLTENQSLIIIPTKLDQHLEPKPFEKDEWVIENQQKDEEFREDLKEILYKRIENYIPEIQKITNITEKEIDALIEGYIMGHIDLPPDTPKWIRELFELS